MTFLVTIGCRVKGKFGPLVEGQGAKRRTRSVLIGTVVASRPEKTWRVYWDDICRTADHSKGLSFVARRDPSLSDIDLATLNLPEFYLGNADHLRNYNSTSARSTNSSPPTSTITDASEDDLSRHNEVAARILANTASTATASTPSAGAATISAPPAGAAATTTPAAAATSTPAGTAATPADTATTTTPTGTTPAGTATTIGTAAVTGTAGTEPLGATGAEDTEEPDDGENPSYDENEYDLDPNWIIEEMMLEGDHHTQQRARYLREKANMIERKVSVTVGKQLETTTWIMRDDVKSDETNQKVEFHKKLGIRGFDFNHLPVRADGKNDRINFLDLVKHLWPGDWKAQVVNANKYIKEFNDSKAKSRRRIHPISHKEFWAFFGILLVARLEGTPGGNLWKTGGKTEGYKEILNLDLKVMKQYRFKELVTYLPFMWADESLKGTDPWWQIVRAFESFAENRKRTVLSSNDLTVDESMSALRPRTTKTGNLPHLSFVKRKPEDLGTEAKTGACTEVYMMLWMEICRAKEDPNGRDFFVEWKKKTTATTLRFLRDTCQRDLYQKSDEERSAENPHQLKTGINENATEDCVMGDSWFGSVATVLAARKALPEKKSCIVQIKTAHSRSPKLFVENTMKDWPGGTHMVMETTIEGEKLFCVGYKYSKRKCLVFLFNEGASHTEPGEPYMARWVDDNGNSRYREVPRPFCCSKYFKYSNVIDVHNQMRQKELRLEKHWVTQDGFFRLLTTIFGVCVVDVWNGYKYHLPDRHRHKECELMDVVNMMAMDLLQNKESDSISSTSTNDERSLIIGLAHSEVTLLSPSSAVSNITNPTFDTDTDETMMEVEVARHQLVLCQDTVSVGRKRHISKTGYVRMVEGTRRLRYNCRECKEKGLKRRVSYYCAGCAAPRDCLKYWCCVECYVDHSKKKVRTCE
jgi:hypothetical protein